jgi:Tol biopolymer transport system component
MSAIGLNVNEMNPHSKTSLSRNILPSRGSAQRARGSFCALLTLASLIFSPPTFANPTHQNVEDILKLSDISAPQFSPSGRWIAFSRYQINPDANSRYTLHYLYDTQSATFKTLSGVGTKLGWRPKRDFLLFVSEGTGAKTINQINPESLASEVWLTLPGKAANIKIAPNEQNLYYTASYECQSTQPGEKTYRAKPCNSLYRIKLATQQTEKLLELKTFIQNYDISPTGMLALEIIPEAALNRQLTDIALLDPEKPQLQWIILDSGLDMGPNWSPDGRYMAYLSSGNQDAWSSQYHLRVWDSRTQKTKTLTSPQEGNIANLIWKLDSSGVYYTKAQSVNKEIWFSNLSGKDMRVSSGDVLIENFDLNPSNQTHMSFPLENMNQPKELYFNGKIITNFNFHNRTQNLGETRVVEWRSNG